MDEITHEMWKDGKGRHGYSANNSKVLIDHQHWSLTTFSIEELKCMGWEVRPIHIELENK